MIEFFVLMFKNQKYHNEIHDWSVPPFSQDYDLASRSIHVVCVNFICECRDL